jgi:hypothetical protein
MEASLRKARAQGRLNGKVRPLARDLPEEPSPSASDRVTATSEKQIAANRRNAARSKGPEARSSRNAVRHGLSRPVSRAGAATEIGECAHELWGDEGSPAGLDLATAAVEAQLELCGIRRERKRIPDLKAIKRSVRIERCERRAESRRKMALGQTIAFVLPPNFQMRGRAQKSKQRTTTAIWQNEPNSRLTNAFRRLWVRRDVLPSIATRSSLSSQHAATHDEKHSVNSLGSMRFMTQRSQSAQGMPKWNSAKPRRKARCALPQSTMSS